MRIAALCSLAAAVQLVAAGGTLAPVAGGKLHARNPVNVVGTTAKVGSYTGNVAHSGGKLKMRDVSDDHSARADPFTGDVAFPGDKVKRERSGNAAIAKPFTGDVAFPGDKVKKDVSDDHSARADPFTGVIAFPGDRRVRRTF